MLLELRYDREDGLSMSIHCSCTCAYGFLTRKVVEMQTNQ